MRLRYLVLALALAPPAQAQNEAPPFSDPALYRLPEREGIVPWRLLAQVKPVKVQDRLLPQYSDGVIALDQKTIRIQGFMLPLEVGDRQRHFLLSAIPQSCPFHVHIGGAETLVEVKASKPVAFTWDAVVMAGRLSVLKDDPDGVLYRLTEAVQSQ
jgi:uncharacterized protein